MNPITIPIHLAVPALICLTAVLFIIAKRRVLFTDPRRKILWTSLTLFLLLYLIVVGRATFQDIYYQWDLNRYDLDQDGFFGGGEITPDQEAAMFRLINDVGRNFSFITGFIFSAMIGGTFYIAGRTYLFLRERLSKKRHT